MKNILSVCAFLLAFGALPLWGQSQDPLNEDQTTVRILEGDNSDPSRSEEHTSELQSP